jgi:signal transduction histidine kinase
MKISQIIILSFFVILVFFSASYYINYRLYISVTENATRFENSSLIVRNSNRFQRNYLNMVSSLRGYLVTNEISFLQTYDSAILENNEILDELHSLVPDGSEQRILLDDIRELQTYWVDEFAAPLLSARELIDSDADRKKFRDMYREKLGNRLDKDVEASLQQKFLAFVNNEYGTRAMNRQSMESALLRTKKVSFNLTVASILLGACIAIFIAKYISSRILKMVHMANSIADGNYKVHVKEYSGSELGLLAQALNNMADILDRNFTQLKRQKDEVDQFAHIVSHDLRAPLRGIDNVLNWLEEDHNQEFSSTVREYHRIMRGRVARAENLLKGILMYARIGKEAATNELVDLNKMIADIRGDLSATSTVTLQVEGKLPVLYTQRVPLEQVFTNLIVNAFKYHDKERGHVRVFYQHEGSHYRFFVEDDGPGILQIYHQKIFQIFQTLIERDSIESVGVGLAIVKKILDDRKLNIRVKSTPGMGTTFSFSWPVNEYDEKSSEYSVD